MNNAGVLLVGCILMVACVAGAFGGMASRGHVVKQLDGRRDSLSSLTKQVTTAQAASWGNDKRYLLNATQLELANPDLGKWFVNDQLTKHEIQAFEEGASYELAVDDSFVRVLMNNGKVTSVNCKNMGSKCPTADHLNRQSRTADAS